MKLEDKNDEALMGLNSRKRLSQNADWRVLFPESVVKEVSGEKYQKKVMDLKNYSYWYGNSKQHCQANVMDKGRNFYSVTISNAPTRYGDSWKNASMNCSCPDGRRNILCSHIAAVLYKWEKSHGPWILEETDTEWRSRLLILDIKEDHESREKEWAAKASNVFPALDYFKNLWDSNGLVFFDLKKILSSCQTNLYYTDRADRLKKANCLHDFSYHVDKSRTGVKSLHASCNFVGSLESGSVSCVLGATKINSIEDQVHYVYGRGIERVERRGKENGFLDEYELLLFGEIIYALANEKIEDQTDKAALDFFSHLEKSERKHIRSSASKAKKEEKQKIINIEPRISVDQGMAKLSFKIGKVGSRMYVLRNLEDFVEAVGSEDTLDLSKTESLDFSKQEVTDSSLVWMQFIQRRVNEIFTVNDKLSRKNYGYSTPSISVSWQQELAGSVLDSFYDLAEGTECEYQDKTNNVKNASIRIGHTRLHFRLLSDRLSDARGKFAGIAVSGFVPVLIDGSSDNYILNSEYLSRVSEEEEAALAPFRYVADPSGYFRFQVGLDKLHEFYYRVLPSLMENPSVEFEDRCGDEASAYLPPEPSFTFFLDLDKDVISCRGRVSYGDAKYDLRSRRNSTERKKTVNKGFKAALGNEAAPTTALNPTSGKENNFDGYRDVLQEDRVISVIQEYLPEYDSKSISFMNIADEDFLYRFLTEGIPLLSRYGEIRATDSFQKQRVRSIPTMKVGISIESGIMDLSITSQNLSEDELVALFESYKKKKRYHRLANGEFINLDEDESLREIETLLEGMELAPLDVIREKAHIPVYRALYLDRLLEEHDSIASSRDRTYRNLVKNFRTINDSDYDIPEELSDVLRPYQSYGHKWLRTLEGAGFGGILADEMGLGKTLQMISVLLSAKEHGNRKPSLIVCPASLVYNWQEELRRFAPELRTMALAGNLSSRKKALQALHEVNSEGNPILPDPAEKTVIVEGESNPDVPLLPSEGHQEGVNASGIKSTNDDDADEKNDVYDVYVTSYDLLKRDISQYEGLDFYTCVLDEAQYIKNQKAIASKAVKTIRSAHRFALTGTPIENRLSELWSIFDFLMPGFLYKSDEFVKRFEIPITKGKDKEATDKLKKLTGPFILRRKKEDVLKDLPQKLEEVRYARITGEQQKVYDGQVVHMKRMIGQISNKGEDKLRILAELTRIRQICCDPSLVLENYHGESAKREACLELIKSAIDGGHRMLIFSQFTSMLALLEEDLSRENIRFYKIIGQTPKDKRISLVHAFNEGDVPVFLISLKAGGTGLNLTGADMVIHYDPWWNLSAQNQATDRAHRIGQTKQVTVYRIILKDTIEEKILHMQEAKKDLADAILEGQGESLLSLSKEELLELLS